MTTLTKEKELRASIGRLNSYRKTNILLGIGGQFESHGKPATYLIDGVEDGDGIIRVDRIYINKDTPEEDLDKIIAHVESNIGLYTKYPFLQGIDLDDDDSIERRAAYVVVENFDVIEDLIDVHFPLEQRDEKFHETFMGICSFRTFTKMGISAGTIMVQDHFYVPIFNVDVFEYLRGKFNKRLEYLYETNKEFEDQVDRLSQKFKLN